MISSLFVRMGQSPVITTGLWPIAINKEEITSSLFVRMGQRPVVTTGLWPIATNKEETISSSFICMGQSLVITTGLWPICKNKEESDNFFFIYTYGPKACSDYRTLFGPYIEEETISFLFVAMGQKSLVILYPVITTHYRPLTHTYE